MYSHRQTSVITTSSGTLRFDCADRLLNDSVFGVGDARLLVLFRGNAEEQYGLQARDHEARCASSATSFERELKNARHARDRAALLALFR